MFFDFEYFCQQNRITYISHGVNVKSGEINIPCPFCAETSDPDPSCHCGVDSERAVFSCWRNSSHRGKKLHRLIMKILRCSYVQAQTILGLPVWTTPPSIFKKFDEDVESLFDADEEVEIPQLEFLKDFRTFGTKFHFEKDFVNYLISRDFSKNDVVKLATQYNLRWAVNGPFRQRIIFPNYYNQQLINWTSRSIVPSPVRYRALSETEGAMVSIKKSIYQWDSLIANPTRCAVLMEGPLDAIKLDFYGQKFGFRGTCLFSKQTTLEQQSLIIALFDVFDEVLVWLDDDAKDNAERLIAQCEGLVNLTLAKVNPGIHDAGELNWQEIKQWCQQQLESLDERESQTRSRQRTDRSTKSHMPRLWLQS